MKSSPVRPVVWVMVIALAFVGISGCIQSQQRTAGMPQAGEYAFLDHQRYYNGMLVSGTCPPSAINFSTYHLATDTGSLEGLVLFEINDTLLLIYGESTTLSGDYGTGGSGILDGVYALPHTAGDITMNGFTSEGTMYLTYHNQTIALAPGTQWTDISTGTEVTTACTLNRTTTDILTYYGNYQKSTIKKAKIVG
ncbi:hypothetical protein [Methanoregula sp.]|jgi:hypothetical protein|uniref:hypothetical protein n=1 Tax=Methanoregula sp. TaxID=2052170 RepID=UPI003562DCFD